MLLGKQKVNQAIFAELDPIIENDEQSENITYFSDSHCENTYDELMSYHPPEQSECRSRGRYTMTRPQSNLRDENSSNRGSQIRKVSVAELSVTERNNGLSEKSGSHNYRNSDLALVRWGSSGKVQSGAGHVGGSSAGTSTEKDLVPGMNNDPKSNQNGSAVSNQQAEDQKQKLLQLKNQVQNMIDGIHEKSE